MANAFVVVHTLDAFYDSKELVAVFSTREKAEQFINKPNKDGYYLFGPLGIEEHTIDEET